MKIRIDIDEETVRKLVAMHIREVTGNDAIASKDVTIEVKSKQNFKSEWEQASFRAVYENANFP